MQPPVVKTVWTHADFDVMGWHDNHVHGLGFRVQEAEWKSNLVLDIDYIVQWVCDEQKCSFWIAPATLTFHDVADAKINIQWGGYGFGIHPFSLHGITRELDDDRSRSGLPHYKWAIGINWPSGEITFSGSGYTQILRAPPVLSTEQKLTRPLPEEL